MRRVAISICGSFPQMREVQYQNEIASRRTAKRNIKMRLHSDGHRSVGKKVKYDCAKMHNHILFIELPILDYRNRWIISSWQDRK